MAKKHSSLKRGRSISIYVSFPVWRSPARQLLQYGGEKEQPETVYLYARADPAPSQSGLDSFLSSRDDSGQPASSPSVGRRPLLITARILEEAQSPSSRHDSCKYSARHRGAVEDVLSTKRRTSFE